MIKSRVRQLAENIHSDYKGQTLNLFVVMAGAYKFAKDLAKYLKKINKREEEKVELRPYFFKIDSNRNPELFENPVMKVSFEEEDVKEQHVLIIKDIYDSGVYMQSINEKINAFQPKSVNYAIAFHKKNPNNLKYNFVGRYTGFLIPDQFVIGYAVGTNEDFIDIPHLCLINQSGLDALRQ